MTIYKKISSHTKLIKGFFLFGLSAIFLFTGSIASAGQAPLSVYPKQDLTSKCAGLIGADLVFCYAENDPFLSNEACKNAPEIYTEPYQKKFYQEECFVNLAYKTKNHEYCDLVTDDFQKASCYSYIAQKTNNSKLCNSLPDYSTQSTDQAYGYNKERCLGEFFDYQKKSGRQLVGWQNQAQYSLYYGGLSFVGLLFRILILTITVLFGYVVVISVNHLKGRPAVFSKERRKWVAIGALVPFVISLFSYRVFFFISPLAVLLSIHSSPVLPSLYKIFIWRLFYSVGWLVLFVIIDYLWNTYQIKRKKRYPLYIALFIALVIISNVIAFLSLIPET